VLDVARCRICNRVLTSEASIAVMIGPECLERAIADQPELARLRAVFAGAIRRVRAVSDEMTGDLFEEMESSCGEG